MKKLVEQSEKNSPEEYDKIFFARREKGPDETDIRRWKKLLKHYKGTRLLDMGCLDSRVPVYAAQKNPHAEIWGIDLSEEAIFNMQLEFPHAFYAVQDAYNTKFPDEYFGYVVAGEIIEHLEDPPRFISEAMRVLRPGGTFALSTPKEEAIEPGAVDAERHLWSYTADDLINMLKPYGSVKIEVLGSQFFPYYKYHFPTLIAFCKKK